jgi:two-component system, NtrC family, response regulator AtoC
MSTRPKVSVLVPEPAKAREAENHAYLGSTSAAMRAIEQVMTDIAPTEIPVLLIGESGTGKDIVALHLHRHSLRHAQAFRKIVSSSATPEMLSLAALSREPGTLFLDEITDLSPESQARLLQSLVEAENSAKTAPPRLICSSTRNIEELMRAGRFREELYFRLNGVCLRLPPLRHRSDDVSALAEFFLVKYAGMFQRPKPALSPQGLHALEEHTWPGNIRELENSMKKTVILGEEVSQFADHHGGPARSASRPVGISLKDAARAASRQAERELILQALARTRWNRKRAAVELRISYKALLYKLKQIGPEEVAGS